MIQTNTPCDRRADGSTVDQLRDDIDRGRTGDKVEGSDPAAVPLGTDEEAAGTPVPADHIHATRQSETARGGVPPQHRRGPGAAWFLIGFVVVVLCTFSILTIAHVI